MLNTSKLNVGLAWWPQFDMITSIGHDDLGLRWCPRFDMIPSVWHDDLGLKWWSRLDIITFIVWHNDEDYFQNKHYPPRYQKHTCIYIIRTSILGAWVGIIVTFAVSGLLCEYGFDNGWGSIFYITGEFIGFQIFCCWT